MSAKFHWMVQTVGYPCGSWPDLKIARHCIVFLLSDGEKIIADGGYRDGYYQFDTPTGLHGASDKMKSVVRARHETVNARLKSFKVLGSEFRHAIRLHSMCFHAVANLVVLGLRESPLFTVNYDE